MSVPAPPTAGEAAWLASQRRWSATWRRTVLASLILAYLVAVVDEVGRYRSGGLAVVAYASVVVFGVVYVVTVVSCVQAPAARFWPSLAAMVALTIGEIALVRATAFVMCVYLTVLVVARLGLRSVPVVVAMTVAAWLVPVAVGPWHDGLSTGVSNATVIAIPVVAVVTFGLLDVLAGNRALADARAEVARLSAENERARIARDLHDLLGHSLTTITVKAGLAHRVASVDLPRALAEMAEVEVLSRQAVADVRAAVSDYREVTLAGELASGRELLRAAGVAAVLPPATDRVDPVHQELFGWVVREGVTNVVRHARATTCTVLLTAHSVEIIDDGIGIEAPAGNGLVGLAERVTPAGGRVEAGPCHPPGSRPSGWRLSVAVGEGS